MKNTLIISAIAIMFLGFSCTQEKSPIEGIWQDFRQPEVKWEIKKVNEDFVGKRVGGDDYYKYDTETWRADKAYKLLRFKPIIEGGSSLIFNPSDGTILRTPPGRIYKKIGESK